MCYNKLNTCQSQYAPMMGILQIGLDIIMEKPILSVSHKLLTKANLYNLENAEKPPFHALILQNGSDINK